MQLLLYFMQESSGNYTPGSATALLFGNITSWILQQTLITSARVNVHVHEVTITMWRSKGACTGTL